MIDFEVLKKKCQESPERETLEAAQKKEEGILAKMQSARADIAALEKAIADKETASIAALLDDPDGVNAIRKESARLKETLGDATYWLAKIETTALPQVRRELAAAERAYKAAVKTVISASAKQVALNVTDAVESLYKMFLAWDSGLAGLYKSIDVFFPMDEFRIRIESELRERLGRKQCADCQPFIEHISKELQRATVLWNQTGFVPKKPDVAETKEPAETEQTVGENDVFLTTK